MRPVQISCISDWEPQLGEFGRTATGMDMVGCVVVRPAAGMPLCALSSYRATFSVHLPHVGSPQPSKRTTLAAWGPLLGLTMRARNALGAPSAAQLREAAFNFFRRRDAIWLLVMPLWATPSSHWQAEKRCAGFDQLPVDTAPESAELEPYLFGAFATTKVGGRFPWILTCARPSSALLRPCLDDVDRSSPSFDLCLGDPRLACNSPSLGPIYASSGLCQPIQHAMQYVGPSLEEERRVVERAMPT